MVSTELWPLAKVGGLADMVGSLSGSLRKLGHDVRCALPRYPSVDRALPEGARVVSRRKVPLALHDGAIEVDLEWVEAEGLSLLLVDHEIFRRDGIYDDPVSRRGYADNGRRWAVFCRGVHASVGLDGWVPEIVHGHDHHAGLLMGLLRWLAPPGGLPRNPATVFTLHNVGYQGIEPPSWIIDSSLPGEMFDPDGPLHFQGKANLMKIGIQAADRLTTVSPRYAREISTSEEFGEGLTEDLASRASDLTGILNGIDTEVWDPERDPYLPFHYSAVRPANKAGNRAALRNEMKLAATSKPGPLLAMVSRLTSQKGLDILLPAMGSILAGGAQMVLLGSGEERYESALKEMESRHEGRFSVRLGFDEGLAHRIEAGADIFLVPSRYEPCGLNQMYSLRYGTVPVVRSVGGLADTVVDLDQDPKRANGFVFEPYQEAQLLRAVERAVEAWRNRKLWKELMLRGMSADFSWERSARLYLQVYEKAVARARGS